MTQNINDASLPLEFLRQVALSPYGNAMHALTHYRVRGHSRTAACTVPDWCHVPYCDFVTAALMTIFGELPEADDVAQLPTKTRTEIADGAARTAAAAAWRMTKGIYRFDPGLRQALWDTPVRGDVPTALLYRLPEKCVYITAPPDGHDGWLGTGVFVHLDWEPSGRHFLRFLMVSRPPDGGVLLVMPLQMSLDEGTLEDGVRNAGIVWYSRDGHTVEGAELSERLRKTARLVGSLLSLVLYLCSEEPDITGKGQPGNPRPTKTKKGLRTFAAPGVRTWNVGARIGAALRATQSAEDREYGVTGTGRARPRPHVRRAHWSVYWTGPKTVEQTPVLRWIPPLLIAANESGEELPAVIRAVG